DEQERRLGREFARQYHLITRTSRLDEVADDLVRHFAARGYRGKGMFVSIDKATAVSMYDRVKPRWEALIAEEEARLVTAGPEEREAINEKHAWMREVDMAVVVSQGQNEIDDLRQRGLDILLHRKRMQEEDLETKF